MSKKQKSSSQSTETRTPTNPTWVTEGLAGVGGSLQSLMGRNPLDFVAGPTALQNKSYQDAGNLSLSPLYGQASDLFGSVAKAGPNTYGAQGYDASGYGATNATSRGYDAQNATSQGYDAQGYTGQGYQARNVGDAVGYDPTSASASTYSASSLLDGLEKYMSPYTGQVVDAALADYDYGAGQTRANQALDEARSGAFGGSGAQIGRSMTEGELARGRGSLSAGLRDQGFTRGAGLSAQDAGFRNDASRFNADAQTRVSMSNADAANQAAALRASAQNQFLMTDAEAANAAARFGSDALNTSNQFSTAARNNALQFSSDAVNRATLANTDAANQAARFGSDAFNRTSLANSDAANQAAQFGADARNTAARFGAGAQNDAGQFNAQAMDAALARQLSAGGALAGLGQTMGADTRSNIALQNALGGDQRAIQQALQGAPLSVLQQISQMYGGLPLNLLTGQTSTGSSSGTSKTYDPMGTLATLLGAGGTAAEGTAKFMAAFSDRRLKTDIERIGEREDGLGVYLFRYFWSPVQHIGVMAQEVLKVKPEAVIHTPSGYMAVDYGAL
jgi:hypothetical protein